MRTISEAKQSLPSAIAAVVLAGVVVATLGGCYQRVVSARGFGADQYPVAEPYQENSKLDDWVFGERTTPNKSKLKNMDSK